MPPDNEERRPGDGAAFETSLTKTTVTAEDTPYAAQAFAYLRKGWRGVLPLPNRAKSPVPAGYTGRAGAWPSPADIQTFIDHDPQLGNIALRLPEDVIGLDVDMYNGKQGAATLARLEAELGPLPPTLMSTSRTDGSGIRLYRVPFHPTWRDPGPGVEIIHYGWRYIVVWPSIHPDDRTYVWVDQVTGEAIEAPVSGNPWVMTELPKMWVERLSSDEHIDKASVTDPEVVAWLNALPAGPPCRATTNALDDFTTKLADAVDGGSRHDAVLRPSARLVRVGDLGHRGVRDALTVARQRFLDAATQPPRERGPGEAVAEWRRMIAGAVAIVKAEPTPDDKRRCCGPRLVGITRPAETTSDSPARLLLADLLAAAREYQDIPDPGHLFCALAVTATRDLDEEPVWLLLVAAPSSGKTETTRALDDVADDRLDDITAAGLLSWKPGKRARETGVLTRIPNKAVVTFGDLSSLLADSNSGRRDTTFALLRKAYDGHVARDIGTAPEPLRWEGKLTVVAAVTGIIDHYTAHANALGPRWLYYRLPARDTKGRRKASKLARKGGLDDARDRLRKLAAEAVAAARQVIDDTELDDDIDAAIENAALVTCWGRASVPRHTYGRREIDGTPIVEEPPRLLRQLRGLARGLLALGLDRGEVTTLARRVALDSMPLARRQVLDVLADGEPVTTSAVASRAEMHRHVARRQLEELEVIGVVAAHRDGAEPGDDEPDRRTATWRLRGEDGALVAKVINATNASSQGWHKNISTYTHPPEQAEKDPYGGAYNFVPPPEPVMTIGELADCVVCGLQTRVHYDDKPACPNCHGSAA